VQPRLWTPESLFQLVVALPPGKRAYAYIMHPSKAGLKACLQLGAARDICWALCGAGDGIIEKIVSATHIIR